MQALFLARRSLLICISLWLIFLAARVFQLDKLPGAFAHDEVYYAAQSKAIRISGSDLTGTWHPWYFTAASSLYAELPGTVMAIGSVFWPDSLASPRMASAILGSLLPFVLASLAYRFQRSTATFWLTVIIAGCNPWLFQFSRMSFDSIFSLFFYASGLSLLLWRSGWKKLSAIVPLFLGFYQYQGLKLLLVPLVCTAIGFLLLEEWQAAGTKAKLQKVLLPIRPALLVGLLSVLIFAGFALRLGGQSSAGRVNDLIFFRNDQTQQSVNDQRRLSLPSPLGSLVSNKYALIGTTFIQKYADSFDVSQIFTRGESLRNPFSVSTFGMMYVVDALFVLIALMAIWQTPKQRPAALLLSSWLLLAPIPVAVNALDTWLMFRAAWFVPTLLILSGIGAAWLWRHQRKVLIPAAAVYLFFIGVFGYHYWYRYPLYSTTDRGFAERVMASYVTRLQDQHPVKILVNESWFVFQSYLVYRNLITTGNLPAIHQAFADKKYQLGQTEVDTRCFEANPNGETVVISDAANTACDSSSKPASSSAKQVTTIASVIDSGAQFRIYGDPLCTQFNLRSYVQIEARNQLNIEQLSNKDFCETYLTYQSLK